ncbi:MAG: ABC transporter ATP-binding protein [Chloroflexota bacterium]|nr:MAG: ABC transporter [Chloroflexota bacterium]
MSAEAPVIETRELSKVYPGRPPKTALDRLTLSVNRGEVFGYLGPNGAGKTTTIKLLLDLIRPTSGSVSLFGLDANRDSVAIRRRVGFLPGELNLWDNQTSLEVIRYFGRVRGSLDMSYVKTLAERLDFDLTRKIRTYSTGNKRKLGLILAFMNRPELLILDEPTTGLDPLVQQTFYQMVQEARAEGRTVFMSSHVLSEVQAICERVGIIRNGRLQTVERVDALTQVDFRWVSLRLRDPVPPDALAHVPGVSDVVVNGNTVQLRLTGDFDPLLRALSNTYVQDMRVQEPTLEEIFLAYYSDTPPVNNQRRFATSNRGAAR